MWSFSLKDNFLNVENLRPQIIFVAERLRVQERGTQSEFVACRTYPVQHHTADCTTVRTAVLQCTDTCRITRSLHVLFVTTHWG